MRRLLLIAVMAVATEVCFGVVAPAVELVPGERKFLRTCGTCHSITRPLAAPRSGEEWSSTENRMFRHMRAMRLTTNDRDAAGIARFLARENQKGCGKAIDQSFASLPCSTRGSPLH